VGVRAAMRPGSAATRLANINAPSPTTTIHSTGTVGSGTAEIPLANRAQSHRPTALAAVRTLVSGHGAVAVTGAR
jgi:hypothetical protein